MTTSNQPLTLEVHGLTRQEISERGIRVMFRDEYEDRVVAAFKRGVQYRDTTNAPVPADAEIVAKVEAGDAQ